jgi:hypothetical protein
MDDLRRNLAGGNFFKNSHGFEMNRSSDAHGSAPKMAKSAKGCNKAKSAPFAAFLYRFVAWMRRETILLGETERANSARSKAN